MAQQDVRYYLNGMFLELDGNTLRTVTTDGHRLALCAQPLETQVQEERSGVIIPRKGVIELSRLLEETETPVVLSLGRTHMRAQLKEICFNVSYLLDILNALDSEHVEIALSDSNSSALIQDAGGGAAQYVVMPMRLS